MYFVVVCKTIKSDSRVLDVVSRVLTEHKKSSIFGRRTRVKSVHLVAYDRQRNKRVHCI